MTERIEDGFGNEWWTCGADCSLHIVRPGKVRCERDGEGCPGRPPPARQHYGVGGVP